MAKDSVSEFPSVTRSKTKPFTIKGAGSGSKLGSHATAEGLMSAGSRSPAAIARLGHKAMSGVAPIGTINLGDSAGKNGGSDY